MCTGGRRFVAAALERKFDLLLPCGRDSARPSRFVRQDYRICRINRIFQGVSRFIAFEPLEPP